MKEEIKKVVDLQEELDIDVLVHGEPEVSSFLLILYDNSDVNSKLVLVVLVDVSDETCFNNFVEKRHG